VPKSTSRNVPRTSPTTAARMRFTPSRSTVADA
jgi:hypothetical protein